MELQKGILKTHGVFNLESTVKIFKAERITGKESIDGLFELQEEMQRGSQAHKAAVLVSYFYFMHLNGFLACV